MNSRSLMASLVAVSAVLVFGQIRAEYTCYVATDGVDAEGRGTSDNPFLTIGYAVSAAKTAIDGGAASATVSVAAGTYSTAAAIAIDAPISVIGATGDPKDVTVNVSAAVRHFTLNHAEAKLEALTINGGGVSGRGGVRVNSAGGRVVNCVLIRNRYEQTGGAVYMTSSSGFLDRCVFSNNVAVAASTKGHAVNMTAGVLRNCLVVNNGSSDYHYGTGGSVYATGGRVENCSFCGNVDYKMPGVYAGSSAVVVNCILGRGWGPALSSASGAYYDGTASLFTSNICPVAISAKNILSDRIFRNAEKGDFLPGDDAQDVAQALDWMTDAVDLAGMNRAMGAGADIGCYEMPVTFVKVTSSAAAGISPLSVTFTVTTLDSCPQGVECEWDWNGDGTVDATTSGTTTHEFTSGNYNVRVKVKDVATGTTYAPATPMPIKVSPSTLYVAPMAAHSSFPYDTWDKAATSLADAVAAAVGGCEVIVSNGTYTLGAMLKIDKGVTVRGFSGDPKDVTMKVTGTQRHFALDHSSAALKAMTIDGGKVSGRGGVNITGGGGSVVNCVLVGNRSNPLFTGGAADMRSSNGLIDRCTISNNVWTGSGSSSRMAQVLYMTAGKLRNCLVVDNGTTDAQWNASGTIYAFGGRIENCSFYGNKEYKVPGVLSGFMIG